MRLYETKSHERDQRKLPELLLQFTKDGQGDVAPISDNERPVGIGIRIRNDNGNGEGLECFQQRGART